MIFFNLSSKKRGLLKKAEPVIPDLKLARIQFQHIVEYTELRWRNGDIFLDDHNDMDLAEDALDILDKLEDMGYDTGIEETEKVMEATWPKRLYGRPPKGNFISRRKRGV